jgi:methylated-DNA-[protein]-cysteine S-methyltransferase
MAAALVIFSIGPREGQRQPASELTIRTMDSIAICTLPSPIGPLRIAARHDGVTGVFFDGRESPRTTDADIEDARANAMLHRACAELAEYFDGSLRRFTVPCVLTGTAFQELVWQSLRSIAYGEVVSYRTVAERVGNVKAVRAVGAANGQNPVPIIIPCHRVIGSNGSLTGFGGGVERKQWLLAHEGASSSILI